jgi:hypothetical protein
VSSQGGDILTSSGGTTWTSRTSGTTSALNDVAFGKSLNDGTNLFAAVGVDGAVSTSSDGTSWTTENIGITINLFGVTYGNSIWVIVGAEGYIFSTEDEDTLTSRTSGTTAHLNRVFYKE